MNSLNVRLEDDQLQDLAVRIASLINPPSRPLNLADAAREIGVSRQTLVNHMNAGLIKRVPCTGRRVLIPQSEVTRLKEGTPKPKRVA